MDYTYDGANRMTSRWGASVTYDDTAYGAGSNIVWDGLRTNTWDSQNRLIGCASNGTNSTFFYGADGLRRRMIFYQTGLPTKTTDYIIDGQNVAQEITRDDENNILANATYCYGPRGAECRRDNLTGAERWYVLDGLGSVLAEVNEQGQAKANHRCDVWGNDRLLNPGDPKSKHAFVGNLGHTSGDTPGLIYMRARWYDPTVGRFISEDPGRDGLNWFTYCDGNPVGRTDPSGRYLFHVLHSCYDEAKDKIQGMLWARGINGRIQTKLVDTMFQWAAKYNLLGEDAALVFGNGSMEIAGVSTRYGVYKFMVHTAAREAPHVQLWLQSKGANAEWNYLTDLL